MAAKHIHEIRDPIHTFIRFDDHERAVLNSRPVQCLRHIQQLALTHLVYPGTTHKRFEHSLGVMELAGRVFDVVTGEGATTNEIRELLPVLRRPDELAFWRRVLRLAALCHDTGHLPFSHAAEHELLPNGWDHERLTRALISSAELQALWTEGDPPLDPNHIVTLAIGPRRAADLKPSLWEAILSEIVIGDALGVDRMDYLLRDSHHIGVAYGRFDHFRLVDTLRILPRPPQGEEAEVVEPALGVESGGLQSAEALLLARYLMYSQVYFHPVRVAYDLHLRDFLKAWRPSGTFPTDVEGHLGFTDHEVMAALLAAMRDPGKPGHESARRIVQREHFRLLYQRQPDDVAAHPEPGRVVAEHAAQQFARDQVKHSQYPSGLRSGEGQLRGVQQLDFPVLTRDNRVASAFGLSGVLRHLPAATYDYVFVDPRIRDEAERWLRTERRSILESVSGGGIGTA